MIDFRTKAQIRKAEKDAAVASAFRAYKEQTGYADSRIIEAMARSGEYGYTSFNGLHASLMRTKTIKSNGNDRTAS